MTEPFAHTSGPRNAKIVIVGEAWGETEEKLQLPFAGYSGKELFNILTEVFHDIEPKEAAFVKQCMNSTLWVKEREPWLQSASIMFTNVLAKRPPNNNLDAWCGKKADVGTSYPFPPLKQGKYLLWEHLDEVQRLMVELREVQPNLIIAMGNTACWAILRTTAISKIRGAVAMSPYGKTLPTYHPAAIMRQWSWRPILVTDLMKARREMDTPDIIRPEREVLVSPSQSDMSNWFEAYAKNASALAVDIETLRGQISMVGFASSPKQALVIPFIKSNGASYWETHEQELHAWSMVERLLQLPCPKIFQNGLYDLQYLLKMGLTPRNCLHDTMLLHHSIYPEMQKGLGFLGSVYTSEAAWKIMRNKAEELKKDE
jgi:uracil-DNA glycosylase